MPDIADSFNERVLLVVTDRVRSDKINLSFMKAGLPIMDVEEGITNILPKLRNTKYDWIILDSGIAKDVSLVVRRIKESNYGNRLPVVVIQEERVFDTYGDLYEAGVNYVTSEPFDVYEANKVCWVMTSLLSFVGKFKEMSERLYR
jgi:DNA-binding response OmpR family regulator